MGRLILIGLLAAASVAAAEGERLPSWAELLDGAKADPQAASRCDALVAKAREAAALPIVRRARSLQEVGQNRSWLDGRSHALEPEIKETFALAMSDFAACRLLADELPLLAAGYRLTHDAALRERILAQLEETAGWSPLQRPGWTLYTPGSRLPEGGKDGNWLATGCGVRAIGDTLDLLPPGTVPEPLLQRLRALLEGEVAGVVDDWKTQRSWFIRGHNPITNQWVLPTEGLVRACLILGVDERRESYELGVANLLEALNAHGERGEFEEGFGYAGFTVTSMLHAAHAMAVSGDRRAIDAPFLRHFPTWLAHHFQPGNMVINCFDAGGAHDAAKGTAPLFSLLAVCTGSPVARWALAEHTGGPSDDVAGLAAGALPPAGPEAAPPLYAAYERATRVNWRSGWNPDATGVWVRGGHPLDQHDHQDRGHVNFIRRGKPILIEAGTPSYHHPRMGTHYSSGVGHNVLQLGTVAPEESAPAGETVRHPGWQKPGGVAPIEVRRLDASGGEVGVDAAACYDNLKQWRRTASWDADTLMVVDDVALTEGTDTVLFRWHLGTDQQPTVEGEGTRYTVSWADGKILFEATAPIRVTSVSLPDHTLPNHSGDDDPANSHTCIVIQSAEPVSTFGLRTRVAAPAEPK